MSPATLTARFPDVPRLRFGLRLPPDRAEALARDLIAEFDLPAGSVVDQASLKALSLDIFERTFAVTAALNVLTLGVAGLAMFASLLTLAADAPAAARAGLGDGADAAAAGGARPAAHACCWRLLTLVAALPLGLALAWVLLAVINVAAFGWRLPMHVFPADWLRLGALAVLAAVLAGADPGAAPAPGSRRATC